MIIKVSEIDTGYFQIQIFVIVISENGNACIENENKESSDTEWNKDEDGIDDNHSKNQLNSRKDDTFDSDVEEEEEHVPLNIETTSDIEKSDDDLDGSIELANNDDSDKDENCETSKPSEDISDPLQIDNSNETEENEHPELDALSKELETNSDDNTKDKIDLIEITEDNEVAGSIENCNPEEVESSSHCKSPNNAITIIDDNSNEAVDKNSEGIDKTISKERNESEIDNKPDGRKSPRSEDLEEKHSEIVEKNSELENNSKLKENNAKFEEKNSKLEEKKKQDEEENIVIDIEDDDTQSKPEKNSIEKIIDNKIKNGRDKHISEDKQQESNENGLQNEKEDKANDIERGCPLLMETLTRKNDKEFEAEEDREDDMDEALFDPLLLCPDISMEIDEAPVITTNGKNLSFIIMSS